MNRLQIKANKAANNPTSRRLPPVQQLPEESLYRKDLGELEEKILKADLEIFKFETLKPIVDLSREVEITTPQVKLEESGTALQYARIRERLVANDPAGQCPFEGFKNTNFSELSQSTFYQYKAALQNYAQQVIITQASGVYYTLAKKEHKKRVSGIYAGCENASEQFSQNPQLFASAIRFAQEFPPAVKTGTQNHVNRLANANEPSLHMKAVEKTKDIGADDALISNRRRTTKNANLNKLALNEDTGMSRSMMKQVRNSKRTDVTYFNKKSLSRDFRDAAWDYLATYEGKTSLNRTQNTDRMRSVAVLSLTGCRPSELVHGVQVFVENDAQREDTAALIFRIQGSKVTEFDTDTESSLITKITKKELARKTEFINSQENLESSEKGHQWRYIRIESSQPEALWLADTLIDEQTKQGGLNYAPLSPERLGLSEYEVVADLPQEQIIAYGFIQPSYVRKNDIDVENPVQRHRAVDALDKQIKQLGKSVFKGARKPLTPYVFRHAFASEVKAFAMSSADPDENVQDRSATMGHRSTRTITRYGSSSAAQVGEADASQLAILPFQ